MPWGVSQRSLHRRTLKVQDDKAREGSVFPLFDDNGQTRALMLLLSGSPRIAFVEWRPLLFVRRRFGPHRLQLEAAGLEDVGPWQVEQLAELWHFDPWWVLDNAPYRDHPARAALKRTNLERYERSWRGLWFDEDLERVIALASVSKELSVGARAFAAPERRPFSPGELAATRRQRGAAEAERREQRSPTVTETWRLRPFWHCSVDR